MKKTDCPRCKGPCRYSSTRICRTLFVTREKQRRFRQLQRASWWKRYIPLGTVHAPEPQPIDREDLYTPMDF